jgi:hypothetical protein
MYKSKFLPLLVGSFILLQVSCRKDKAEVDCSTIQETSAAFTMEELTTIPADGFYTETDTIYANKIVRFRATALGAASYTWYIGTDTVKTQEVLKTITHTWANQTLPITLIVKKDKSACFPTDDGYDSITKYLTVMPLTLFDNNTTSRLEGVYKVKSPLLSDSVLITVDIFYKNATEQYLNLQNYNGTNASCTEVIGKWNLDWNYRQLFIFSPSVTMQCDNVQGDIYCDANNNAILNLTSGGYVNGVYKKKLHYWNYRGRKIQ